MAKALKYLLLPLLLVVVFFAYYEALPSSYHLDDFDVIVNNNLVDAPILPLVKKYPTRFLVFFTYWLNLRPSVTDFFARFYEPEQAPLVSLHLFNLFIHALNSWLIYLISLPLLLPLRLRERLSQAPNSYHLIAAALAVFFALHPLQTQSVIYIGQRFTLLSGFFYFLALFFVTRAYFAAWSKKVALTLAILACGIGLFCKETVVTAPISCFILLWLFEAEPGLKYWRKNQKKILLWAGIIIPLLFIILPALVFCQLNHWKFELIKKSLIAVGGTGLIDVNVAGLTRFTYFLTQPFVILFYVVLFVCPTMLCVDHDIPLCTSLLSWQWLLPVAVLLAVFFVCFKYRHKRPLLAWGFFFFIFPLLPQSSIMPTLDLSFEHRMYLSVAGLLWFSTDLLTLLCEKLPKGFLYAVRVGVPIVLLLFAYATHERSKVWESELTLWQDAYKKAPNKQRVVLNLSSAILETTGDCEAVIKLMSKALPHWHTVRPSAYALLGSAYQNVGNLKDAIRCYQHAVVLEKSSLVYRYNLAMLYFFNSRQGQALSELEKLIDRDPTFADAYYLKGLVEHKLNRKKDALKDLQTYLDLAPHGEHVEDAKSRLSKIRDPKKLLPKSKK